MNWIIKFLLRVGAVILIIHLTALMRLNENSTKDTIVIVSVFVLVLSLLNTFIRPILSILSLPITFLTLGLFQLVVNTAVVLMAVRVVSNIEIDGFVNALLFSILFSAISWAIEQIVP
ncbi:MAG: phage holin family protein [Chitinophagales bacterium]|nr:phage holin family protein [Chitinophagales bacterium]